MDDQKWSVAGCELRISSVGGTRTSFATRSSQLARSELALGDLNSWAVGCGNAEGGSAARGEAIAHGSACES